MRPIKKIIFAFVIAVLSTSATHVRAQTALTLVDTDTGADIGFGPTIPARIYSTWQAAKWGLDFLVAWSKAADRDVLFGYQLNKLTEQQYSELLNLQKRKETLLVIINEIPGGPLPVLGPDKGYLAAAIVYISHDRPNSTDVEAKMRAPDFRNRVIPAAVAMAALKGAGVQLSKLGDLRQIVASTGSITFIASTARLKNAQIDQYFMVPKSAWAPASQSDVGQRWGMNLTSN